MGAPITHPILRKAEIEENIDEDIPLIREYKSELRILLLSDTHGDTNALKSLGCHLRNKPKYDCILMAGDFYRFRDPSKRSAREDKKAERMLIYTLNYVHDVGRAPVIYVPGNHDPLKEYTREISTPETYNIHKSSIRIVEDLAIFGLGGSIPMLYYMDNTLCGYTIPFPYSDDSMFSIDAQQVFQEALSKYNKSISLIFLSHIGSFYSPTAIDDYGDQVAYGGSKSLGRLLQGNCERIFLHVHGHHHESARAKWVEMEGVVQVLNPGALSEGHFGEIVLGNGGDGRWKLISNRDITLLA